jgi:hypothetical protein
MYLRPNRRITLDEFAAVCVADMHKIGYSTATAQDVIDCYEAKKAGLKMPHGPIGAFVSGALDAIEEEGSTMKTEQTTLPKIGEPVYTDLCDRGTVYVDGGYDISPASEYGSRLFNAGINYVDPDGIGRGEKP